MTWIVHSVKSPRSSPAALRDIRRTSAPATVKEALLSGFTLSPQAAKGQYAKYWHKTLSAYRGADPIWNLDPRGDKMIIDELHVDSKVVVDCLFSDTNAIAVLPDPRRQLNLPNQTLWGFRLKVNGSKSSVEIVSNLDPNQLPPPIDLLVNGACRAALWRRIGDRWSLVQVWL